ncbi:MAG: hypothetical protein AABX70_07665 [Nanoarchaeota archaeon]
MDLNKLVRDIAHLHIGKMTRDTALLPKLCGTLLIVGGVLCCFIYLRNLFSLPF